MLVSAAVMCLTAYSVGVAELNFAKEEMRLSIERMLAQEQISSTEETNLTAFRIEDCTSKARALSVILNRDPGVESDIEILEETKESMGLDEIIITDGDGKITASTDATTGNDIGNDIRFQEFIQGLKDKSFSACKKDSTNENSYISAVSRLDSDGLVITKTSYFSQGSDEGYLYEGSERLTGLLDLETGECTLLFESSGDTVYFPSIYSFKGMPAQGKFKLFRTRLGGQSVFVYYTGTDGNYAFSSVPSKSVYSTRNAVLISQLICFPIISAAVLLAVRMQLIKQKVY